MLWLPRQLLLVVDGTVGRLAIATETPAINRR
jgi:hypothetical protein